MDMRLWIRRGLTTVMVACISILSAQLESFAGQGNGNAFGHLKFHGNKFRFNKNFNNGNKFRFGKQFPPDRGNAFVNVKSAPYKARGDGSTDDTASIQMAANDALAQHKFVFFPAGTYLHAGTITFNGVAVTGVGAPTTLLASNVNSSALILTGASPAISNLIVSTQGLNDSDPTPNASQGNIVVQNSSGFAIGNVTIVQGTGVTGVYVLNSSMGSINSATFWGTGDLDDVGVLIAQSSNVSVTGNLLQNEGVGVSVIPAGMPSQSIAVLQNTIGNASYPTRVNGVDLEGASTLSACQNSISLANMNSGTGPIALTNCDNFIVSQNSTTGGELGVSVAGAGPTSGNAVSQNNVGNCGAAGLFLNNAATTAIQLNGNMLGECGLNDSGSSVNNAVILVTGASASGNTTVITNNVYQGHLNGLISYITSLFHIPAANVTGNTQTFTSLPNNIP